VPTEVGQGEHLVLRGGEAMQCRADLAGRDTRQRRLVGAGAGVGDQASPASGTATTRRRIVLSLRTASTARWWVTVSSQVTNPPRGGSYRVGSRHSVRKTSCTTSSAGFSSAQIRRPSE